MKDLQTTYLDSFLCSVQVGMLRLELVKKRKHLLAEGGEVNDC